jgi:hypothetical protein
MLGAISLGILLFARRKIRGVFRGPWSRDLKLHVVAAGMLVVSLSCLRFKYPYYFLPVFPFLSVLTACLFDKALKSLGRTFTGKSLDLVMIPAGLALPVLLVILPVPLTAEQFPALRKFIPFIQTYSGPGDRVMYINHTQPYGNDGDAYPEIAFYTGLTFTSSSCEAAALKVTRTHPEWILTSGKTAGECLSAKLLANYRFRLKAGNQFLLSNRTPGSRPDEAFDLTPLYRELGVSVDHEAPPLPATQFHRYEQDDIRPGSTAVESQGASVSSE